MEIDLEQYIVDNHKNQGSNLTHLGEVCAACGSARARLRRRDQRNHGRPMPLPQRARQLRAMHCTARAPNDRRAAVGVDNPCSHARAHAQRRWGST